MRELDSLFLRLLVTHPVSVRRRRAPQLHVAVLAAVTAFGCGSTQEDADGAGSSVVPTSSTGGMSTATASSSQGSSSTPSTTTPPTNMPSTPEPTASDTGTGAAPTTEPTGPDTDPTGPDATDSIDTSTDDAPTLDPNTDTEGAEGGATDPGTEDTGADAGDPSMQGNAGAPNMPDLGSDEMPWFSFFTTSLDGLLSLAPDPVNGFGGDLGGLQGADEICTALARQSNPTDAKTWRAFLSTGGFDGNDPVDAIDRVGDGPWYDYNGRLLAENVDGLIPGEDGRPVGDPQLTEMFTDEYGEPIKPSDDIDNHDTLTGSGDDGRLFVEDDAGELATCSDWTSNTLRDENVGGEGGGPGGGGSRGRVPVGHSWPRSDSNGRNWSHEHNVNGCEPGVFIGVGGGAPPDNFTVGGGGGYGAFYCFALEAIAPE